MELASYPRRAPPKGCCLHLHPQSESQFLPASLGGSVILSCKSDPSPFQMTASAHFPVFWLLQMSAPLAFEGKLFWFLILQVQGSLTRYLKVGLRPLPFWQRIIAIVIILLFLCLPFGSLDTIVSCFLFCCSSFFYVFVVEEFFFQSSGHCHQYLLCKQLSFCIPMGGGELSTFLLCHVNHYLIYVCLKAKTMLLRFLYIYSMFQFQEQETPEFVLFQDSFGYMNSLEIQYEFQDGFFYFCKKIFLNFDNI